MRGKSSHLTPLASAPAGYDHPHPRTQPRSRGKGRNLFWLWSGFILFVAAMLALDLGVLNRRSHVVRTREALLFSGFCMALALIFSVLLYFAYRDHWLGLGQTIGQPLSGAEAARQFLAGWLIEQSLSLDNIFVFALIFAYFHVPLKLQNRALLWGVIGALVLRGLMIAAGATLIHRFGWITYAFGALLILTAIKMMYAQDEDINPDKNMLVRLARKLYPVSTEFDGQHWMTRAEGRRTFTPLFLTMPAIATTDVMFAIDSIPAVFAVTSDSFLVFTSNVFAVLNLRSLYFALASLLRKFRFLKWSLIFILAYVGAKMLAAQVIEARWNIPVETQTVITLIVIGIALSAGILASLFVRAPGGRASRCGACGADRIGGWSHCPQCGELTR